MKQDRLDVAEKQKQKVARSLDKLCEKVGVLGYTMWVSEIKVYLQTPTNVGARFVFDNGQRDTHVIIYNGQVRSLINDHGDEMLEKFMGTYAG